MIVDGLRLMVYFGDALETGHRLTSDVLMERLAGHGVTVSALARGIEGFGLNRRIHAARLPDLSGDLPLVAAAIDTRERIEAVFEDAAQIVPRGLLTLESVTLVTGCDVATAEVPSDGGHWSRLTVYCGRRERYRQVVQILKVSGAPGATVILGVDGTVHGRRARAHLFGCNSDVPMAVISVGRTAAIRQALPHLGECLEDPIATLEPLSMLKHDGNGIDLPPGRGSGWRKISVMTRETAQVEGRALFTELTRRLRTGGAAGATTTRGEWGYSSDEPPHGDRFARLTSHTPTLTTTIDTTDNIARLWPIVDRLTAHHGVVTIGEVPVSRELGKGPGGPSQD